MVGQMQNVLWGRESDGVKTTHIFLKHKTVLKIFFIEIAKAI